MNLSALWTKIFRLAGSLPFITWEARAADPRAHIREVTFDQERLPDESQWQRVETVLANGLASSETIRRRHAEAADQIDAAIYALQRLKDEIAPACMSPVRVAAPICAATFALRSRQEPFRRREPIAA